MCHIHIYESEKASLGQRLQARKKLEKYGYLENGGFVIKRCKNCNGLMIGHEKEENECKENWINYETIKKLEDKTVDKILEKVVARLNSSDKKLDKMFVEQDLGKKVVPKQNENSSKLNVSQEEEVMKVMRAKIEDQEKELKEMREKIKGQEVLEEMIAKAEELLKENPMNVSQKEEELTKEEVKEMRDKIRDQEEE